MLLDLSVKNEADAKALSLYRRRTGLYHQLQHQIPLGAGE